jgi:hypothetical protein
MATKDRENIIPAKILNIEDLSDCRDVKIVRNKSPLFDRADELSAFADIPVGNDFCQMLQKIVAETGILVK